MEHQQRTKDDNVTSKVRENLRLYAERRKGQGYGVNKIVESFLGRDFTQEPTETVVLDGEILLNYLDEIGQG